MGPQESGFFRSKATAGEAVIIPQLHEAFIVDQENVPEIAEHSFVHHSFNGVKAEGKDVHLV